MWIYFAGDNVSINIESSKKHKHNDNLSSLQFSYAKSSPQSPSLSPLFYINNAYHITHCYGNLL
ncbi:hypothetical protein [Helicobacter sp. MIT 14-3879]|uniref:hypothetical protein n=1 Tax=Helicobacter sp. MIT 14-3879 TaxID=2040649 RepID=UPI0015F1533F|nr:hypothetical protein [Helicobacter sp. MIT 14-3879]